MKEPWPEICLAAMSTARAEQREADAAIADLHGLYDAESDGCQGCGELIAAAIRKGE